GVEDASDIDAVRTLGVVDLPTIQKKLNLHYSLSLDLFGSEVSTKAANAFNAGIKGRYQEIKIEDDHKLQDATYPVVQVEDGKVMMKDLPALSAINMRLRDDYIRDAQGGLNRWNAMVGKMGVPFEMKLPHPGFHRAIGAFADAKISPGGEVVSEEEWTRRRGEWL